MSTQCCTLRLPMWQCYKVVPACTVCKFNWFPPLTPIEKCASGKLVCASSLNLQRLLSLNKLFALFLPAWTQSPQLTETERKIWALEIIFSGNTLKKKTYKNILIQRSPCTLCGVWCRKSFQRVSQYITQPTVILDVPFSQIWNCVTQIHSL